MSKILKFIFIISILFVIFFSIFILNYLNLIPQKTYSNKNFNITTYKSNYDTDNDGIDDQTDILNNARSYVETKPKYMSKYYSSRLSK